MNKTVNGKQVTAEHIDKMAFMMIEAANDSAYAQEHVNIMLNIFANSKEFKFDDDFIDMLKKFIGETVVKKVFTAWLKTQDKTL